MPEGMPTATQLWEGEVAFFSIDTDVIQAEGYSFENGALNQLHRQLPPTMELQLTDVVANEVINHLMKPVLQSIQQFESSSTQLRRATNIPMEAVGELFQSLSPAASARAFFRQRVETYAEKCRGGILPITGSNVLAQMFSKYFSVEAPFGLRTDKKSEFPDAASLLLLEEFATKNQSMGVVVSMDGGWQTFANHSDHLYCVKSLEELTALFTATGEVANRIQEKIRAAIEDHKSPLRMQLLDSLEEHVGNAGWGVGDISSTDGARVEGEVYEVIVSDYELEPDETAVWNSDGDPGVWVVEVTAKVKVMVSTSVTIFLWDSIDREELSFGGDSVETEAEIEVKAFLTCSQVQVGSDPNDWDVDVEITASDYQVNVGEVDSFYE